jgi:hypothetical protein
MNKTLLRIQSNLDDIEACVKQLEADPIAKVWMVSLFPRHRTLSELVENTKQMLEGFVREYEENDE